MVRRKHCGFDEHASELERSLLHAFAREEEQVETIREVVLLLESLLHRDKLQLLAVLMGDGGSARPPKE